jgi:methylated-DNA-[protein]-cysteine S-methyltransferase
MTTGLSLFVTGIGVCGVVWSDDGIVSTYLPDRSEALETACPEDVAAAVDGIRRLLAGEHVDLGDVVIDDTRVEDFARRVYGIARTIPPGTTITYGDIAARMGDLSMSRAVGQALGRNPYPLVVPCHRVVAAGGDPGGFSAHGGTITKRRLLAIEGEPIHGAPTLFDEQVGPP